MFFPAMGSVDQAKEAERTPSIKIPSTSDYGRLNHIPQNTADDRVEQAHAELM